MADRGGDLLVGEGDGVVRVIERDLRAVDLLVQRVDTTAVFGDLLLELRGFGPLVVDRSSRRGSGTEEGAHCREHECE